MTTLPNHPPLWRERGALPVSAVPVSYEKAGKGRCDWCAMDPRNLVVGPGGHKLCSNCLIELLEGPPPRKCGLCGKPETRVRLRPGPWGEVWCDACLTP